jgi:hypothetical protein
MKHKEKPKRGEKKGPILCKKHEKENLKLLDVLKKTKLVLLRA